MDGGNAVLGGEKIGDIFVREEAELHQGGTQATALFLLSFRGLFQLLWGNDLLFDEKVTQPLRHTQNSYPQGWNDAWHLCRHSANGRPSMGGTRVIRVDTNCQR